MSKPYPKREDFDQCCECGHTDVAHETRHEKPVINGFWNKLKAFWYYQPRIEVKGKCSRCYCPKYNFETYKKKWFNE